MHAKYLHVGGRAELETDLGQRGVSVRDESGKREDGRDAESDAGRHGVAIEPERHPRQNDDETRRNVDLNHVVAETTDKV